MFLFNRVFNSTLQSKIAYLLSMLIASMTSCSKFFNIVDFFLVSRVGERPYSQTFRTNFNIFINTYLNMGLDF